MSIDISDVYKIFRDKFSKEVCYGYPVKVSFCQDTSRVYVTVEIPIVDKCIDSFMQPNVDKIRIVFDKLYKEYTDLGCNICYSVPLEHECISADVNNIPLEKLYFSLAFLG